MTKEMVSDNVKDRASKIKYLEKVIKCVSYASRKNLTVRPGKVVAGQEAEKTNELLQALANILDNNIDTRDAVERVKNGGKSTKTPVDSSNRKEDKVPSTASSKLKSKRGGTSLSHGSRSHSRDKQESSRESTASSNKSRRTSIDKHEQNGKPEAIIENENGADSGLGTLEEGNNWKVKARCN